MGKLPKFAGWVSLALALSCAHGGGSSWRRLHEQVSALHQQGRYPEATRLAHQALEVAQEELGPDHPKTTQSWEVLAVLYFVQGKFPEAEGFAKRALVLREQNASELGTSLKILGALYLAEGRHGEAEPILKRSADIASAIHGPDHPNVAKSLGNLATVYKAQGRHGKAEQLYRKVLRIWDKSGGPDSIYAPSTMNNLARLLYEHRGKPKEAEELYQKALALREKAFGPNHPQTADLLKGMAEFYRRTGRDGDAQRLQRRLAEIASYADRPGGSSP